MDLNIVLDPSEYYDLVLKKAGVEPVAQNIEKTAELLGVTPDVARIAKAFHEQMGLDGVKYASAKERADDALLMAKNYVEHRDAVYAQTARDVDGLVAKFAGVELPERLREVPMSEILKMAALQAEDAERYDAEQHAAFSAKYPNPELVTAKVAADGAAAPKPFAVPPHYSGGTVDFKNFSEGSYKTLAPALGHTQDTGHREFVAKQMGFDPADTELDKHVHNVLDATHKAGGSIEDGLAQYRDSMKEQQPSWAKRNAHLLVPGALLGAGAAYALWKRKKAKDRGNALSPQA